MAAKLIAKGTIPYPLGICHEDQWCPHTVQAALAADSNGTLVIQATPIVAGNGGGDKELLVHPPRIALWWAFEEEELVFQREVPLDEQDGACISSQTGCYKNCPNVLETVVTEGGDHYEGSGCPLWHHPLVLVVT